MRPCASAQCRRRGNNVAGNSGAGWSEGGDDEGGDDDGREDDEVGGVDVAVGEYDAVAVVPATESRAVL